MRRGFEHLPWTSGCVGGRTDNHRTGEISDLRGSPLAPTSLAPNFAFFKLSFVKTCP